MESASRPMEAISELETVEKINLLGFKKVFADLEIKEF